MKNLIVLVFCLLSIMVSAQSEAKNCYDSYADKFEERGANQVSDGWHEHVIITVRTGNDAQCLVGKVKVENGSVKVMHIGFADGTYEKDPIRKTWKHDKVSSPVIENGISKTMITVDNELYNVIFPKSIKPKKKQYQAAPSADDL